MNRLFLLLTLVLASTQLRGQASDTLRQTSPNGELQVTLTIGTDGELTYSLSSRARPVLTPSKLALKIQHKTIKTFRFLRSVAAEHDTTWQPIYGERSHVRDRYHQITVELEAVKNRMRLFLVMRVYDEGLAFRYVIPEQASWPRITLEEFSQFSFAQDYPCWAAYRAQAEYEQIPLSRVKPGCERPLVVRLGDDLYAALGEAALVDYARMKFRGDKKARYTLVTQLDGQVESALPLQTPWRSVLVGDSPGQLLERNYMLLNLNEPNRIRDASWIKPGKVIREVTLTTRGGLACVDFCAAHNLQFVEFDAGWYGHEYKENSDASTITVDPKRSPGPLDLHRVIEYGKEKGVGVILYVNRRAMEKQLDEILPLYQSWCVAGVKYGFVNVGSQKWTAWLHDAVRKAAAHKLMVDIHDEYRPTGVSRTWPNLMTQEGIRGDEESPSNEHTLITLFTRMIAGAGDNTICYFADRVDEKMGSHASQLAKAVCLYSPWQFLYWYDRPEQSPRKKGGAGAVRNVITDEPELAFFDRVPTVWDETRVLEGEIGRYAAIARRRGREWFIGAINGGQSREFVLPLDFLSEGQFKATIYSDDADLDTRTRVRIDHAVVDATTVLQQMVLPNNGLAIWLRPVKGDE